MCKDSDNLDINNRLSQFLSIYLNFYQFYGEFKHFAGGI